ncbi:MAG: hypothetical protein ACLUTA_16235 [Blautia wexlerae]
MDSEEKAEDADAAATEDSDAASDDTKDAGNNRRTGRDRGSRR